MSAHPLLPVLVVTGIGVERRLAAGSRRQAICAGGSPARLRAMLSKRQSAYSAVISFGMAGGLDPALMPGDIVMATDIVADGARWPANPDILRAWVRQRPTGVSRIFQAKLVGVDAPLLTPAEKMRLYGATGAVAADMESHVAAAFAARHGIPFAALRTVCDPANRTLPPLVSTALHSDGNIDLPNMLGALLRQPLQAAALPRLAWEASASLASLRRSRFLLDVASTTATHRSHPLGDVP